MDHFLIFLAVVLPLIELLGVLAAVHAVMNARTSQGATAWAIALVTLHHGAHPRQPAPAATLSLAAVAQATPISPSPPPTATPTPTLSPTPIPDFAWQGRTIAQGEGTTGMIEVQAAGLESHPVVLRSGGWQSPPQSTGGQLASGSSETKFGNLAPGDYVVVLVGLADLKVTLGPDQFKVIEFRYDFIDSPEN